MKYSKTYTVYILRCGDNSYYTGLTSSLEQRYYQHRSGQFIGCYTYKRRPLQLVYTAEFNDVYDAIAWERRIKRWSRAKKTALIMQNQSLLELYSRRKTKITPLQSIRYYIRYLVKKITVGHGS
jgi:putative endonuclease